MRSRKLLLILYLNYTLESLNVLLVERAQDFKDFLFPFANNVPILKTPMSAVVVTFTRVLVSLFNERVVDSADSLHDYLVPRGPAVNKRSSLLRLQLTASK